MKTKGIDKFSKRLDDIFNQGNPTKAQILDAYNKAVSESQQAPQSKESESNGMFYIDESGPHKESGEKTNFMQIRDLTDEEWMKRPKEEILQLYKNCYNLLIDQVGLKEKSQQAGQNDVKKEKLNDLIDVEKRDTFTSEQNPSGDYDIHIPFVTKKGKKYRLVPTIGK